MKLYSLPCGSAAAARSEWQTVFLLQIADETALLPLAFFPRLKELTFHNNPLAAARSGTV